jgi:hypothetical protein
MSVRQSNLLRLLQLVHQEVLIPQGEMVRPLTAATQTTAL